MSDWRVFPERSWAEVRGSLSGFGRGADPFGMAYAVDTSKRILNGRISARIRLGNPARAAGAGVVCRADDLRSMVAFYVISDPQAPGLFSVRITAFKYGTVVAMAGLTVPFALADGEVHVSLQFFSGIMRGEMRSGDGFVAIDRLVPEGPFAGYAGLVRFYNCAVFAHEVHIEEIGMRPVLPEATGKPGARQYKFDVFLSHAQGDSDLIAQVTRRFRQAGISYWIDEEQVKFGDRVVQKIEDGLRDSRLVVVALSEALGESGYSRSEYSPILYREFTGETSRRVIPLSLDGSDSERAVPLLLSEKMRADLTKRENFESFIEFIKNSDVP
ncbi:toll/interleukin-1 receptor domain-containing protein [Micromonospora sp. WMMC250]|uniref:toll/interleukin-1 receptor domain-containing protein n=1 Tax=Micromonospora sp. WMMC250 TaxID=3014781 RepID=UPI0022B6660E|nr:toll/interleukin-1 receptor domain-containing protein [Micromonospora sp. WMMC250]MCZ7377094.1 toll/interleukin-1 receptor domain-containing protein [Micromonospora sp. WMMC250]